ncbi:MAG: substrate-binding domain-containing protein [Planctomycetes bacterium]|nr:substrate-binding domain-containing protein [Planctomycetota bacterium]
MTYRKVLDHLRKHADIAGLYMANQSTAAAIAAVEDAGLTGRVRIVCHDLPSSTRQSLRMGLLDFAVDQNIYNQGFKPVTLLSDVLMAGKYPEEERQYAPITIACSESV